MQNDSDFSIMPTKTVWHGTVQQRAMARKEALSIPDGDIRLPMLPTDIAAVHQWARQALGLTDRALARLMLQMQKGQIFVPGLDLLQLALEETIEAWRIETFEHFGLDIKVQAMKNAKPLYAKISELGSCFVGFDQYAFMPSVETPPKRLFVGLDTRALKVWYRKRWQPLRVYADALLSIIPQKSSDDQLTQQYRWYQSNGKAFNITGLPAEIREVIYQYALPATVELFPWKDRKRIKRRQYSIRQARPDLSILFVKNRDVHRVASYMLDLHTEFLATYPRGITYMLTSTPRLTTNIRHLQLSLTHNEYFKLFGFQLNDAITYGNDGGNRIRGLRDMRVSSLELQIKAPSALTEENWFDDACQRTIVEWLFEAAWPWIRGHPFTFEGYIKTSQKKEYEAKGAEEKKAFDKWVRLMAACGNEGASLREYDEHRRKVDEGSDGGASLDDCAEVECAEDEHDVGFEKRCGMTLPPICLCKTKCTADNWTAED